MVKTRSVEEKVYLLANDAGGYFRLSQCEALGITPMQVYGLVRMGKVVREAAGLFRLASAVEDELYALSLRFEKLVFSHTTALYLLGYSDQAPFRIDVTVPRGFHSAELSKSCAVRQCAAKLRGMGIERVRTHEGNFVPVYSIERTLCELLHAPRDFDKQIFLPALRQFAFQAKRDQLKLFEFARLFRVEEKMTLYLESVL